MTNPKQPRSLLLRQKYCQAASMVCVDPTLENVPVPFWGGFYVLMSQYLKNVKIRYGSIEKDIRMSFFHISNSRTGKGQNSSHAKKVATILGLDWCKRTRFSDAGIVGSIDTDAIKYNMDHNLSEVVPRRGRFSYRNPIVIGDLGTKDIIFFDECKQFLDAQIYNKDVLTILQEALDYPGSISAKFRDVHEINYESMTSIYATTFNLPEIQPALLNQGFFQRIPIYIKEYTPHEIDDLRRAIIQLFDSDNDMGKKYNDMLNEIKQLVDEIDRSPHTIKFSKAAVQAVTNYYDKFSPIMHNSSGDKMKVLMSMSQNIIDTITRVAAIHAVIDNRQEILPQDVVLATPYVRSLADTVINKLDIEQETNNRSNYEMKRVITLVNNYNGNFGKEQLSKMVCQTMHIGRNRSLSLINKAVQQNYLEEQNGEGNTKLIKVSTAES